MYPFWKYLQRAYRVLNVVLRAGNVFSPLVTQQPTLVWLIRLDDPMRERLLFSRFYSWGN